MKKYKFKLSIINFCMAFGLILLQSCAHVPVQPPSIPFGHHEIDALISMIKEQDLLVHTIIRTGRLRLIMDGAKSDANIVIAGTKDPFKINIELTHAWGRPLFQILITGTKIWIVSFTEKRCYYGLLGSLVSTRFFSVCLSDEQIWSFVRGVPVIRRYDSAVSFRGNRISLLNKEYEIRQALDFQPSNNLPAMVSFPLERIELFFSSYNNDNHIRYARKTRLNDYKNKTTLVLRIKQSIFNKDIPESIFEMNIPENFEMLPLKRFGNKSS